MNHELDSVEWWEGREWGMRWVGEVSSKEITFLKLIYSHERIIRSVWTLVAFESIEKIDGKIEEDGR